MRFGATDSLTGLRAVAAAWVLLFHIAIFASALFPPSSIWLVAGFQGYLGVDFFFTLSGFILSHQFMRKMDRLSGLRAVRFWVQRLARIYPMHVTTMIMVAALVEAGTLVGAHSNPWKLSAKLGLANLLLVHAWGWLDKFGWNEPSWSISCEWFAYLLFPLAVVALSKVKRVASSWMVCFIPLVAMWLTVRYALGWPDVTHIPLRYSLIRVSFEFVAGCGAFLVYRAIDKGRVPDWSAAAVVLLMCVAIGFGKADPLVVPLFPLLILVLAAKPSTPVARLLATPAAIYLGEVSFSVYLIHQHVIFAMATFFHLGRAGHYPWAARAAIGLGLVTVVLVPSAIAFQWIEKPARRFVRARLDRWLPEAPEASPLEAGRLGISSSSLR